MEDTRVDTSRPRRGNGNGHRLGGEHAHSSSHPNPNHELRQVGDYRILRRVGEGGMGAVYLGYDEKHDLHVAIKILGEHLACNQDYVDRFYREAKSGLLLNHPNIVRTLSVGQDQQSNKHYLILEYVEGPSAQAMLDRNGPLSVGDAVHITLDVARALEHAHSRNVVHRDIKPDNILITSTGVAKLVDLGLAKRTDEASHLTGAHQGFGTTPYMPYEQALQARSADGRSDIYALGATLYHLVTGKVPFPADNHLEVVERKKKGDFLPVRYHLPETSTLLDRILARMLARQPRDRYQTASELIVDLERSGLASALPSFVDPDQALQDPWVRACLTTNAEPTRMDPESPREAKKTPANKVPVARKSSSPGKGTSGRISRDSERESSTDASPVQSGEESSKRSQIWLVRYRNRAGKIRKGRTTTAHLLERIHDGRLPSDLVVARPDQGNYLSLSRFPEFQKAFQTHKPPRTNSRERPDDTESSPLYSLLPWLITSGVLVAGSAGLLGLWLLRS